MDNNEVKKELIEKAGIIREAAKHISRIKDVVDSFNDKVYNCRFDNAIRELDTDDLRFISHKNHHGYLEVYCYIKGFRYSDNITFIYKNIEENNCFTDKKRIKADGFRDELNKTYSHLMEEATKYENAAKNLDDILDQVDTLKRTLNSIVAALPAIAIDKCHLKRYW